MGRRPMADGVKRTEGNIQEVRHLAIRLCDAQNPLMQPRHLRLEASMQLPHERHLLPLLPPSCSMESFSTLVVHGTTTSSQLAA